MLLVQTWHAGVLVECRRENVIEEGIEIGEKIAGPSTPLRSEFLTFLSCVVVCGRKAPKSICKQASPGFPRLRSGQALRLRATRSLFAIDLQSASFRACDFFDLFVFSAYSTSCMQAPRQIVILSGAHHRLVERHSAC